MMSNIATGRKTRRFQQPLNLVLITREAKDLGRNKMRLGPVVTQIVYAAQSV